MVLYNILLALFSSPLFYYLLVLPALVGATGSGSFFSPLFPLSFPFPFPFFFSFFPFLLFFDCFDAFVRFPFIKHDSGAFILFSTCTTANPTT